MIPVNCEQKSLTKRFRLIRPKEWIILPSRESDNTSGPFMLKRPPDLSAD